ncbi:MAG TPA: ATP-binding cassette domain-containing protein [Bacteroidia bacterium]|jgi:phospholipid/cholesterol/gamma-HCH transport system ATP-binding protein|nr:ATP-binding cassette domain-containing protein [Bacteroidia bacterium]
MSGSIVKIENLKKSFGSNQILNGINLHVEQGENLVVLGKSGSGKSVLIKCLIGLIEADDGNIALFGKSINSIKEHELNSIRKRVGFLFQSAALYDSMTVRENLEFPLRDLKPITPEEINSSVEEALKSVGLKDAVDKMPSALSGGMRKRIGLARTLMLKPELILYDEPTTGLDPITSKEISKLILDVQKKYNTASIIITHDVECARLTSNRMVVVRDGILVAEGTFTELSESKDEWVRSFFK